MPSPKKSSLPSRVQQLESRVAGLEETVKRHRDAVLDLIETFEKFLQNLKETALWNQETTDDWRQRGEALLEQGEMDQKREELRKQLKKQRAMLLDLKLDAQLELGKFPDSSDPGEPKKDE